MKDELETRLTEMPCLGLDGPEADDIPVKIAIITFAFENSKIINWLKERGLHIKNEDWAKLE